MTFSIIIPIYNSSPFINTCVNSILKQTYKDFEIILVNDGSTDDSLEVCQKLKECSNQIKIINKKNGGASSARNEGIKNSIGEYLLFVDSDDYWIDPLALEELRKNIQQNNPDLVLFGALTKNTINNTVKTRVLFTSEDINYLNTHMFIDNLNYLFHLNKFPTSAWSLTVKRAYIIDNNLYFQNGIVAEDIDWMIRIFSNDVKISAIENILYHYHKLRPGSVTSKSGKKSVESLVWIVEKWANKLVQNRSRNQSLIEFLAFHFSTILLSFHKLEKKDKNLFQPRIIQYWWLLNESKNKRVKLVKLICNLYGLTIGSLVLKNLYKFYLETK